MKAAMLVEQRKPLVVAEIGLPEQLKAGQVLVKVHYSGICGSQLGEIDGVKGEDRYLPHLLGHEGSGTVLETGPRVSYVKVGDKVVLHWRKGLGIESETPVYTWNARKVNAGWVTTLNEYAIASENRLTRIPPNSDMEVAMLFGCAVTTGFGVIHNNARLSKGESVVIYGAGGVGLSMVQAAALVGAGPIIAVDLHRNRVDLARRLGATHVVVAAESDARSRIREITGSNGADVFIDNTGVPEVIEMGYELTGPKGRVILVGVPKSGRKVSIYTLPLHFGKVLTGSHGGEAAPEADIPRYLDQFTAGRVKLRELLTDRYTLDQVNDAIAGMRSGDVAGRCMVAL